MLTKLEFLFVFNPLIISGLFCFLKCEIPEFRQGIQEFRHIVFVDNLMVI